MWHKALLTMALLTVLDGAASAAHPLVTDDTGTQGKSRFQLEVNGEIGVDRQREDNVKVEETASEISAVLSFGLAENLDIVCGVPCQWLRTKEEPEFDPDEPEADIGTLVLDEEGISDVSLELKWAFYKNDCLSLAVKHGVTLPTGDEKKGLGAGRATFGVVFIATQEVDPWAFHLNLGYTHNENRLDERRHIWHASLAATFEAIENLQLVGNVGMERNTDPEQETDPAFGLVGLIFSVAEDVDLDFGFKLGLNHEETDRTFLAGIAIRF